MPTTILATKLYIPALRSKIVTRPRLIERLNAGLSRKLTLISASAGFGKTTLISEWVADCGRPAAWLSLDAGQNDPISFLIYLVAAVRTITPDIGTGVFGALQSPQPPPTESILTALLNEIGTNADPFINPFIIVLDDYHILDSKAVDYALTFLLEHLPPQMHIVIGTREDPRLPLARLRARNQLTELRAADLRFTPDEAAEFLNHVMGLSLSADDIAALDTRTEGWIAGLQLAALALQGAAQGYPNASGDAKAFIKSFTGSHHFVLDYLLEEVLHQQPENVQNFLLHTSILDRLCGSLCDAVLLDPSISGQETLAAVERANLFIIPLDNERRWYRYHHLFADLLRQRFQLTHAAMISELHRRASMWYEANGFDLEAFHHAIAADDFERAARLVEGETMPLFFRGGALPVLNWLGSLPSTLLDSRPSLWVLHASALLFASQITGVEEKLQAAEAALQGVNLDEKTGDPRIRNLIGHIALIRATVAVSRHDDETIMTQSQRALEYLHPHNFPMRTATSWTLGYAYQLRGERAAATRAYTEAAANSEAIGHYIIKLTSNIGLGAMYEAENQLHQAAERFRYVLQIAGDPPPSVVCEAYLGLARIHYQWNDLDAAQQYGQQSLYLARQLDTTDRAAAHEVFLAQLKRTQGDIEAASVLLAQAEQFVRQRQFVQRMPDIAAEQVLLLLHQGNVEAAADLAQAYDLPMSQVRVYLAQGDTASALALLEQHRQYVEAKAWADERLKVMVLQAVALQMHGDIDQSIRQLHDTLIAAEPNGFIRLFLDEGAPMAWLMSILGTRRIMPDYTRTLLAGFAADQQRPSPKSPLPTHSLIEPLSERELEVLRLIEQGLSNDEIGERLFLALSTVKGHNRNIFDKLHVQRRTEAVARARALGLL